MSSDHVRDSASRHAWHVDDVHQSIDAIIHWLRERRKETPTASLAEILKDKQLSREQLLELACIDLIGQRRVGRSVTVEAYLRDFPQLRDDSTRLDLIDAEICVDRELGKSPCLDELANRFADLRSQISDLVEMDPAGHGDLVLMPELGDDHPQKSAAEETGIIDLSECESLQPVSASTPPADAVSGESMEFSIAEASVNRGGAMSEASHPMDVPEWFVGEQCVASGPGHWLIRGRDAQRGETLAMKVIELPVQITRQQVDQLMDACEQAAKVRHPSWVLPAVAAVQNRHLAVIRNWVFANPWQQGSRVASPATRLSQLALVAYALQSAHSVGAAHGGIHPRNLLIDHHGKIQVVDCSAAMAVVKRWFEVDDGFACWPRRQLFDVQDMIRLVVMDVVDWSGTWADDLVPQLRRIADEYPHEACGRIGDALMRWADAPSREPSKTESTAGRLSFGQRFAKWMTGPSR